MLPCRPLIDLWSKYLVTLFKLKRAKNLRMVVFTSSECTSDGVFRPTILNIASMYDMVKHVLYFVAILFHNKL